MGSHNRPAQLTEKIDSLSRISPQIENYFDINHLATYCMEEVISLIISLIENKFSPCLWVFVSWLGQEEPRLIDIYDISSISRSIYFYYILWLWWWYIFYYGSSREILSFIFLDESECSLFHSPVFIGEGAMMKKYAWPC